MRISCHEGKLMSERVRRDSQEEAGQPKEGKGTVACVVAGMQEAVINSFLGETGC